MSEEASPIRSWTIGSITGILIVGALILGVWGRADGPDWALPLGWIFLGCVLLIPGILLLFDPQLSISWFRAMIFRRRDGYTAEPLLWKRLQLGERFLVVIGTLSVSAIGAMILFSSIPSLLLVWGLF